MVVGGGLSSGLSSYLISTHTHTQGERHTHTRGTHTHTRTHKGHTQGRAHTHTHTHTHTAHTHTWVTEWLVWVITNIRSQEKSHYCRVKVPFHWHSFHWHCHIYSYTRPFTEFLCLHLCICIIIHVDCNILYHMHQCHTLQFLQFQLQVELVDHMDSKCPGFRLCCWLATHYFQTV